MDRFDPTAAFFSGLTSVWSRIFLFFLTAVIGHTVGWVSAYTLEGEPFEIAFDFADLVWLPAGFLWQILQNFLFRLGIVYALLLGICLVVLIFTESPPVFVIAFLSILQVWDTFFIQRHMASVSSYFHTLPDFSSWGYLFAGAFTAISVGFVLLPFLIRVIQSARQPG